MIDLSIWDYLIPAMVLSVPFSVGLALLFNAALFRSWPMAWVGVALIGYGLGVLWTFENWL